MLQQETEIGGAHFAAEAPFGHVSHGVGLQSYSGWSACAVAMRCTSMNILDGKCQRLRSLHTACLLNDLHMIQMILWQDKFRKAGSAQGAISTSTESLQKSDDVN